MKPEVKYLLCLKSRLIRRGRVDEASAVSRRVGKLIERVIRVHMRGVEEDGGLERLWRSVGQIKNRGKTK